MSITILAIESSCDDTSAAVVKDGVVLSNEMATQDIHQKYGGVIPELASRAHQQNIVPVVHAALKGASITKEQIDAVAFTRGPGLLGSLLVGTSFAKGFAMAIGKPLIDVNHLQGHLLSHFIKESDSDKDHPEFPYLTLLVSGGHTQIVRVENFLEFEVIGETIDDAVGEAFDKCAKLLNLGYPGGPVVDKLALSGDSMKFRFSKPRIAGLNYSFSGIKTSLLYFLRDRIKENEKFIDENINDICASYQRHLVDILMEKLIKAANEENIKDVALSGGVSANSLLRKRIFDEGLKRGWKTFIPEIKYTTDNAAMIAIAGYYKFVSGYRAPFDIVPVSRSTDYR
ncbi:MAG: tRNA (adenosine(37)-N6)-threonylcarbamoyltransferase complex transferase subunit TsaD [Bacteroidales bacterium]|nr:tRNA (adenosine(37)-N6)-threonylcarbamoyltransferase complex transferase subunit TsaD [Bacteroidales bacterium]